MMETRIIPVLKDNYAYLLLGENGETAIVDPGEAAPVISALDAHGLSLDYILNTHHHGDHIAGNMELKARYSAKIAGPAKEEARIKDMDILLSEGDTFSFGNENICILETPGHTRGHICFYFPQSRAAFTGDTLFLMSTGRLFEGSAEQMWESLEKIMALPGETNIYCGHEYTLENGIFCQSVEPENEDLKKRMHEVRNLRTRSMPTVPATLALEKKTNVFLRAGSAARYAEIRALKDNF
jgi:hydroxyacylglutathione hydrolase